LLIFIEEYQTRRKRDIEAERNYRYYHEWDEDNGYRYFLQYTEKCGKIVDFDQIHYNQNLFGRACFYCGVRSKGVDRIDNEKGYTIENRYFYYYLY
jgi:hypothetical protein